MAEKTLIDLITIVLLGVGAQWLSWRIRIPPISLLLLFGFIAGPITNFLKIDELFGELLFPFVSISVAIILFEGGLSLKLPELKQIGRVVRNLITSGLIATWILISLGAWLILRLTPSLALVTGAILVITGPTVVTPILKSLRVSNRVGSILKWEAMLNDPLGAMLSILVFEAVLAGGFQAATSQMLFGFLKTLLIVPILAIVSAQILALMLKRHSIPDFLHSPVTLAFVITTYGLSNLIQPESGLLAVTVMGMLIANKKGLDVKHIIEFKENLQVLLISSVFIILAARLHYRQLVYAGPAVIAFIVYLVFIVRPFVIFAATRKTELNWREKIFLSAMAPRGIVAAAVASVFALHIENVNARGAEMLLSTIFWVIISTVVIYGLSAPFLAKFLKISKNNPQGILILGCHTWSIRVAKLLQKYGIPILMIDSNYANVASARTERLPAICTNILSGHLLEKLDLNEIGRFMALTSNDEVNSLAALLLRDTLGRSEVYQLISSRSKDEHNGSSARQLHGRFLFSEKATFSSLSHFFQLGGSIETLEITKDSEFDKLKSQYGDNIVPLFLKSETNQIKIITADTPPTPKTGQQLIALIKKTIETETHFG